MAKQWMSRRWIDKEQEANNEDRGGASELPSAYSGQVEGQQQYNEYTLLTSQ